MLAEVRLQTKTHMHAPCGRCLFSQLDLELSCRSGCIFPWQPLPFFSYSVWTISFPLCKVQVHLGAGETPHRQIFKVPFQSLCSSDCLHSLSRHRIIGKQLNMKYLNYTWKNRSGWLDIPGKMGLPIFCCESHCPVGRASGRQVFWDFCCTCLFFCHCVFGRALTACGQQGHTRQVCARYLVWPRPLIYRCAEEHTTFQVALALVPYWSFGACVILAFTEIVLNSHNPEFNLLVLSPLQCPESWDDFSLNVWVIAECSVSVSLQLELLGMAEGLLCSTSVTGRSSALETLACVAYVSCRPMWVTPGFLSLKFLLTKRLRLVPTIHVSRTDFDLQLKKPQTFP